MVGGAARPGRPPVARWCFSEPVARRGRVPNLAVSASQRSRNRRTRPSRRRASPSPPTPPPRSFAPYATAASCIGQIDAGFANLDLRGTNFKVKLGLWYIYGINVAGWPGYEFADGGYGQYINLHAGGGCGGGSPTRTRRPPWRARRARARGDDD